LGAIRRSKAALRPSLDNSVTEFHRLMSGRGLQARATQAPADVKTRAKARATRAALPRSATDVRSRATGPRYSGSGGCQDAG